MKDEDPKLANRRPPPPRVFVPGVGAPESARRGVALPDKAPPRTTSPAGTPSSKGTGGPRKPTPSSDRPPPGAQNTDSPPRTVGGHTARLKLPDLDPVDDPKPARIVRSIGSPPPRTSPFDQDLASELAPRTARGGSVKLDAIDTLDAFDVFEERPPRPMGPRTPTPDSLAIGDDRDPSPPLVHDYDDGPEPRATPTVREEAAALGAQRARDESIDEARRREERFVDDLRREERLLEERRALRRAHEVEDEHARARQRARAAEVASPSLLAAPPSPPLYGPSRSGSGEGPVSRWPIAIAIGAVSLAIGSLLPLPFRKHIAPAHPDASAVLSAAPPTTAAPATSTAAAPPHPAFTGAPGAFPPAPSAVAGSPAAPGTARPAVPPLGTGVKPPPTARPTPRKPGTPLTDIF